MNLKKIIELASKKHKNDKYGDHPYTFHLKGTVEVAKLLLKDYPRLDVIIAALWLHDIKEDTDVTDEEILEAIDNRLDILEIINLVTLEKSNLTKKEKQLKLFPYTRNNQEAVLVKLCDRIFNIENSIKEKNKFKNLYKKEDDRFKFGLFNPDHSYAKKLWSHYENLLK